MPIHFLLNDTWHHSSRKQYWFLTIHANHCNTYKIETQISLWVRNYNRVLVLNLHSLVLLIPLILFWLYLQVDIFNFLRVHSGYWPLPWKHRSQIISWVNKDWLLEEAIFITRIQSYQQTEFIWCRTDK